MILPITFLSARSAHLLQIGPGTRCQIGAVVLDINHRTVTEAPQ